MREYFVKWGGIKMKKVTKRITTLLFSLILSLSFMSNIVVAEEVNFKEIAAGQEFAVEAGSTSATYSFSPDESGWYKFYSSGEGNIEGIITDANAILAKSDNYTYDFLGLYYISGNFKLIHFFEAGKTYYLSGYARSSKCEFSLGLEKLTNATDMSILKQDEINIGIGLKRELSINYTPEDCIPEVVSWSSDNPDIVSVDEEGVCHCKTYGTAIITAVTENGLSDSITVNVTDSSLIYLNEEKENTSGHYRSAGYVFIPEVDANYTFYVKSVSGLTQQAPVEVSIYDKDYNLIAGNGKMETDISLSCYMKKGENYYLKWESYGGDVLGDVTSVIKLEGTPDYEDELDIIKTDELQQMGENIALEDIKVLNLNEEKEIDITFFDAKSIHKFIPEESGDYKFSVIGNDNVRFSVYDENNKGVYVGQEVPLVLRLEAGKTYIINSYILRSAYSGLGKYNIVINKLPKAESININCEEKIVEHIGYEMPLEVINSPEECETEALQWTSSDESVATVKNGVLVLKYVGTATITVKNESGLTDSFEVECIHHPEIKDGESKSLAVFEKSKTFTFIPEVSGVYGFFGRAVLNEDVELRCVIAKPGKEAELVVSGKQFLDLQYPFKAGEVYYISIEAINAEVLGSCDYSLNLISENIIQGDINSDGKVNASDALAVLKHSAKIQLISKDLWNVADINEDSKVDAEDALEILRIAAKISE